MSAEKASRTESTCFCMSGIGHALMHFSNILICRVKYSRASELRSGSGDVRATCKKWLEAKVRGRDYEGRRAFAHQVQDNTGEHSVYGKVDATLHALETRQAKRLQNSFL